MRLCQWWIAALCRPLVAGLATGVGGPLLTLWLGLPLYRLQGRFFHNLQQEELLNFSTAVVVSRVQVRCSNTCRVEG